MTAQIFATFSDDVMNFESYLSWLNDISDTGGITLEDIVFRYGDTVYINKCRDLPKFSNCIDQSIISGR